MKIWSQLYHQQSIHCRNLCRNCGGVCAGLYVHRSTQLTATLPRKPFANSGIGAGTGKFSYLFLRKLTALLRGHNVPLHLVRYCMTDASEKLVTEWRENAYLKEFVGSGILEFEIFQAGQEHKSQRKGPLVAIANYVFDSLPQDAFAIDNGGIHEVLVTTSAAAERRDSVPERLAIFLPELRHLTAALCRRFMERYPGAIPHPAFYCYGPFSRQCASDATATQRFQ